MALLGCAKAAPVGRGHEHPRSQKKRLCDAVELGDAGFAEIQQFPGTAGCSWPTLIGGLWHFWALG